MRRLLDALDAAEAERDEARAASARVREAAARCVADEAAESELTITRQRERLRAREEQVRRLRAEVTRLHTLVATERAARPAPVADDSDALALLDEMNREGRIEYSDYSALHDAVSTATVSPAWDEDTVTEDVARLLYADACSEYDYAWEPNAGTFRDQARELLAVVRRHLPTRPDRETIARALYEADGLDRWDDATDKERKDWLSLADAVLAEWPGESRAQVQDEAVQEVIDFLDSQKGDADAVDFARLAARCVQWWHDARADRIEKGETR
ncbi:hypothetical protein [Sanguibacter massiliensis]|uniref:hypothetical protein n=1 Tax=Sanguibacter massiliensis TaxID=1973217 RepID=UPI000C830A02|nr:hypothetical protein [Sanguibacter massiliensis]